MTNQEFIQQHRTDDVRQLALRKAPDGVSLPFCLAQIEGWQTARSKLPRWAAAEGVLFPPRLSMEQCSSQATAQYKAELVKDLLCQHGNASLADAVPLRMTDLTGGFGVDFSFLAPLFSEAMYVERQEVLCEAARHNLPLLGVPHAEVRRAEATDVLPTLPHQHLIYLDPARRDEAGRKVVALSDCTPDVGALHDELLQHADVVLLKLSPMLDIRQTLRDLPAVRQVHVVSVEGECKELLLVMASESSPTLTLESMSKSGSKSMSKPTYHCVNLGRNPQTLVVEEVPVPTVASAPQRYLYEPNASILKAGVQDVLCRRFGVQKLHPFSHLFTSEARVEDFPGRTFSVAGWSGFGKKDVKALLADVKQANLAVRNFPATVQELRRRLRLGEGGDVYLFATTLADGSHALVRCSKED